MAVATPIPFVKATFFNRCGNVLAGGKVFTYEPRSTTPKVTYNAPISGTPNTNPVILDAAGQADIYLYGRYRIIVQDANGVVVNDSEDIGSWYSGDLDSQLDSVNQYLTDSGDALVASQQERIDQMVNTGLVGAGSTDLLLALPYSRNQRSKNYENMSMRDAGAASGGANDTTPLTTAITTSDNVLFNTQSVIKNCTIDRPTVLQGTGNSYAKANAVNESHVIIADTVNHNNLVKGVTVANMTFKDMPATDNDNWAALHFNTADGGLAAFNRFSDVNTGIRVAYYLDGATSKDNAQIGNVIVGAKTMGIELIQSFYNRTIGNVVHNNGVAVGKHALRWSGNGKGNVAVGNNFRDRSSSGLSIQVGNVNGVAVGNYFENIQLSAIQTNSTTSWSGRHFIGGFVAKNSGLSGADLDLMGQCFIQGLIDGCGDAGLRTSAVATDGKHTIDLQVINASSSGALIRSDKNLVKVLVDANTAGTPVLISGSNNLVIVVCADTTVTNSVYITGNNNVVILQEAGTGTVGFRVDGNDNVITGRVTGQMSINGSRNHWSGNSTGSLIIGASADSNVMSGQASNITDNGTNTNFTGMIGGSARTTGTFTTTSGGVISITHGLKRAPKNVQLTLNQDSPYIMTVTAVSSTTITAKVRDASAAGALLGSGVSVAVNWSASM